MFHPHKSTENCYLLSQLRILKAGSSSVVASISSLSADSKLSEVKKAIHTQRKGLYPDRQSLRLESKGKSLSDDEKLSNLKLNRVDGVEVLYLKDLGPQIGWSTVFLCEYLGPLVCYLITYMRPSILYGSAAASKPMLPVVHYAAICWTVHYAKRILETLFVHRFSHATMPILNLFKNCSYYWGFALFVGYYINHPLYTPAYFGNIQIYAGLISFILFELGNFSIHIALRNLRPAGSKVRKIPYPTSNPFTFLFNFVSCPNYSYEVYSWVAFSLMTQALPALIFTGAGFFQMTIWALGKHRNYKKEFTNYPKGRKSIIPFII